MSARPKIRSAARLLTVPQLKAQAVALDGSPSRVALAAADGEPAQADQQDPSKTTAELWLYGVVGGWWRGFDAESVANALRGLDVDVLYVRIHSPGGLAPDGIAIGNLLRNLDAHVVVVVDGIAASAASVIAIAGDEVIMCPGSQMMLHDASTFAWGNEEDLASQARWIGSQSENYAGVYAYRAGGTVAAWRDVMRADNGRGTWYTAEGTVAAKLADKVGTVVAVGSPPVAPEDDFDEGDEEMLARAAHDLQILEQCVHPAARAAWCGEQPPKPPNASAGGSTHTQGGPAVAFSDEQLTTMRAKLELPDTADEAAILAAVEAVVEDSLEQTPPVKLQIPEGMALVDSAVLTELQEGASAGRAAQQTLAVQERDREITAALSAGKIAATSRDEFVKAWDKDPVSTKALLGALTPGLVPTAESGHESEPNAIGEGFQVSDAELDAFASSLGLSKEALRG